MDAKKHKELFDLVSSKSSFKGFMNYRILVCLLTELDCYDDFLKDVEIKTLEELNNFDTNSDILNLAFYWNDSDRGDIFWRTINLIYISLMISDEESRETLHRASSFDYLNEFRHLTLIYYFGIEKSESMFNFFNSNYYYFPFKPNRLKNYFNKNINIINKMKDLKFKNNKGLENFLNSNGIY